MLLSLWPYYKKNDLYFELPLNTNIVFVINVEATATSQEKINTLYEKNNGW